MTCSKNHTLLKVLAVAVVTVSIFCVGFTLCTLLGYGCNSKSPPKITSDLTDKKQPSSSILGVFKHAAVSTDSHNCSLIGVDILKKGGSVSDAAIASLICIGVIQTACAGLGGGFILVKYNATTKTSKVLTARSRAPLAAHQHMFNGNSTASFGGPLSVAVPGELKGYYELWKESGKLPWNELFETSIKLALGGFEVTPFAAETYEEHKTTIYNDPNLRRTFVNNETGQVYKSGEIIRRPILASTLRQIAEHPDKGDVLYTDTNLMKEFIGDLREYGGILTEQDMLNYKVTWDDPIKENVLRNFTLYTVPPPGGGVLVAFMMKVLSGFDLKPNDVTSYQRIVETFKHAYAKRTWLGDPEDESVQKEIYETVKNLTSPEYIEHIRSLISDNETNNTPEFYGAKYYQSDDHGTSHLSILAENGDAIAVTSTINFELGSAVISKRTGIVYDSAMDDFSSPGIINSQGVPPSRNNLIRPRKRPLSSMSPTIFVNPDGSVRLVLGGAEGVKIPSTVALVAIRNLWFGENIKTAIDSERIHHPLFPMVLLHEAGFDSTILNVLKNIGHQVKQYTAKEYLSKVHAIAVDINGTIYANADIRKNGIVAGF